MYIVNKRFFLIRYKVKINHCEDIYILVRGCFSIFRLLVTYHNLVEYSSFSISYMVLAC